MFFKILVAAAALSSSLLAGDKLIENYNIPLWQEGKVPFALGDGPLDKPFLTVFHPTAGKGEGCSVVIAPGGSNIMLMYGGEGVEVAERFNDWGCAAFVLTYRLAPRYNEAARVADATRAIQLVRSRAAEFKIDPRRVGFAGFSAGSSLARAIPAAATLGDPNAADALDKYSSKPDYLVLVYGPGRSANGEDLKSFPPVFLLSAAFDRGAANGSAQLFLDLNKAGAVAELHIYQKGRHGFGAAYASPEFSPWMDALKHFLVQGAFIKDGKR